MNRHDKNELARKVAVELYEGSRNYRGQRWSSASGREEAVSFEVEVPSLRGVELASLMPVGHESGFDTLVYEVTRDGNKGNRLTYLFHFELITSEDKAVYTGHATVREKSFDWQT